MWFPKEQVRTLRKGKRAPKSFSTSFFLAVRMYWYATQINVGITMQKPICLRASLTLREGRAAVGTDMNASNEAKARHKSLMKVCHEERVRDHGSKEANAELLRKGREP
ncbi:hypothetical protein AVEN_216000-1 [Araneus ventricosus]|uniref:Uncharacterized protein n=1 Tax=Araneus ventricosus TaxID=182803 RepID=A0A4Y2Q2H4_ARAVE|nr:hypothetical protein AVEN_216000-1 [Araneus ventricosus]